MLKKQQSIINFISFVSVEVFILLCHYKQKDQIRELLLHVLYASTLKTPAISITTLLGKLFIFCENICHLNTIGILVWYT